ncbi:SusC/RagA family TonB-linked outer membrane protein (plasmid) [Persicobacter psychrovividus]|uniref:SusC/RagA family TonB-linked outer membrane protein n=2 Tax=Persicobacter psychrovividus TaxID=387638 RepID=A0ABM7VMK0_9BACT|nr:SusC/RagA family TonB-linked outer membrane protein [Persicobacter psychrovividus]
MNDPNYTMKVRHNLRPLLILCLLTFTAMQAMAQVTIRGMVKGASDNAPILGANVVEKGTTNGAITDFDGAFSFTLEGENPSIVISYVGYKPQTIAVGNQTKFDISLEEDVETLEELVVIGYGVQKKSVVTGAIASVSPEEITATPIAKVEQALQGRSAGVFVATNSGAPGSGVSIRVRGVGTNGDSSPLYIVDGLVVANLNNVNPNDIVSMEVLKDAASAAIYGSRGANGVVLVQTKSGKAGTMKVDYDGYFGVQNAWKKVGVLNSREYMTMHNEALYNDGGAPKFSPEQIANPSANTDWQDQIFSNNAPIQSHSISLSGGSEKSTFSSSIGYFGQTGIVAGDKSNYSRLNLRLNSEHKVNKRVTVGQNLGIIMSQSAGIQEQSEFGSILGAALMHDPLTPALITDPEVSKTYDALPHFPVQNSNGQYYGISEQGLREIANPLARIENTNQLYEDRTIQGNIFAKVDMMKGLSFKTDIGFNWWNSQNRSFTPEAYYNEVNYTGLNSAWQEAQSNEYWQWENVLTYNTTVDKHSFGGILGTTAMINKGQAITGTRSNINPAGWDTGWLGNGADDETQKSGGWYYENRLLSFFGRANYDYDERYMVTATVRYDGSSRFGQNNQFGFFPSVSAGWNVHNEEFFNVKAINHLKVRGSWGRVGNENIGNFGYLSTAGRTIPYPIAGSPVNGIAINRPSNADLRWESSEQSNIGFDMGLLDDKFTMTVEYYSKITKDLLADRPQPDYTGQDYPIANLGTVQNQGLELSAQYRKNEGEFNFDIGGNVAFNQNKVTALDNQNGYVPGYTPFAYDGGTRMEIGHTLPYFFGYKTNGIFQNAEEIASYVNAEGQQLQPDAQPGDIRFVDVNNDGSIDADDRTNIGNPIPTITYGMTFNATYKHFDFMMFWQGVAGNEIANVNRRLDLDGQNYSTRTLNRWTGEGSSNNYPRSTYTDANGNYSRLNDMVHIENGAYLRLKNIQLGYTLPEAVAAKVGADRVRVYVSAQNLFTITEYSGFDPEIGGTWWGDFGIDRGVYPQAKTFLMGLNVSF